MGGKWDIGSIENSIHRKGAKTPFDLSGSIGYSVREIQRKLRQLEQGSINELSKFVARVERDRAGRDMAYPRTVSGSIDHSLSGMNRSGDSDPGPGMGAIGSAVGYSLIGTFSSTGST